MISVKCTYEIGTDQEIKKFKFGGGPEGTVEISDDKLVFFKKSKAVAAMFGLIGSAIEGRGKEDFTLTPNMIVSSQISKNRYDIDLNDGRKIILSLQGFNTKNADAAIKKFLTEGKS